MPVYLRQSANDLTGEHTCIMLKQLNRGLVITNIISCLHDRTTLSAIFTAFEFCLGCIITGKTCVNFSAYQMHKQFSGELRDKYVHKLALPLGWCSRPL